jgi:hypothetical protein
VEPIDVVVGCVVAVPSRASNAAASSTEAQRDAVLDHVKGSRRSGAASRP